MLGTQVHEVLRSMGTNFVSDSTVAEESALVEKIELGESLTHAQIPRSVGM